jgi:hypothetical protein
VILASLQEFKRISTKWKLVITDLSPDFKTGALDCFNTKERDPVSKDLLEIVSRNNTFPNV